MKKMNPPQFNRCDITSDYGPTLISNLLAFYDVGEKHLIVSD